MFLRVESRHTSYCCNTDDDSVGGRPHATKCKATNHNTTQHNASNLSYHPLGHPGSVSYYGFSVVPSSNGHAALVVARNECACIACRSFVLHGMNRIEPIRSTIVRLSPLPTFIPLWGKGMEYDDFLPCAGVRRKEGRKQIERCCSCDRIPIR